MKWFLRVAVGLGVLVALAAIALVLLLPTVLDRPEVRDRIAAGAREVTGRELTWGSLDVAFMPPALQVTDAVLQPGGDEAPLGARRIALRISLLPLLGGVVAVDSLEIEGAELEIVRGEDGIELPVSPPDSSPLPAGDDSEQADPKPGTPTSIDAVDGGEGDPISLAVRRVELIDARLVIIDRTTEESGRLVLTGFDATARGQLDTEAPIAFEASGAFESGGDLSVSGEATLGGDWSVRLELAELVLAPLAVWLEGVEMAGRASLVAEATGSKAIPASLELKLNARNLDVVREDLSVEGAVPLTLSANWDEAGNVAGPLETDLEDVAIQVGDQLRKPEGDSLALTGQVRWDGADRLELASARVTLPGVIVTGEFQVLPKIAARLSAPVFDPEPLASWSPAFADAPVTGRVGLEEWTVSLDPLQLGGGIHLESVRLPLEAGHAAVVSGMLEGVGDAVQGSGLEVRVAEQLLMVSLRVTSLSSAPRARVELEGNGLDSSALLAAIGGPDDTLSGPMDLTALVEAPLASDEDLSQVVTGSARFQVAPGRLRGVSLLRSTFDAFGSFGEVALLAGQTFGGSTLQKFYGEDFERLSGSARLAGGVARTNDLRLDYRDYSADLAGTYQLADDRIDMTGQLTLYEEIDRALAAAAPGAEPGTAPERATKKTIPLAHVTGTLADPKVRVTQGTVVAFARSYLDQRNRLGRLEGKVDERLGEGTGKVVLDVLEGILGGKPE
jgi:hypothetical protein